MPFDSEVQALKYSALSEGFMKKKTIILGQGVDPKKKMEVQPVLLSG